MNYIKMIGYAFALAFIAGVLRFTYVSGYDASERFWLDRYTTDLNTANDKLIEAQRNERQAVERQVKIEADLLTKQQEHASNEKTIIDDYRAGTKRLRESLTVKDCPNVSSSTGRTSNSHAASTGGLSEQDVQFLVSEASRADKLAEQLIAAQQIIANDRTVCK